MADEAAHLRAVAKFLPALSGDPHDAATAKHSSTRFNNVLETSDVSSRELPSSDSNSSPPSCASDRLKVQLKEFRRTN